MYNKSLITEDSDESADRIVAIEKAAAGGDSPTKSTTKHQLKKQHVDVVLDEYLDPKQTTNEPHLVACLKYYYCGAAANVADTAITSVDCTPKSRAQYDGGVDDMIMEQRMDDEEDRKLKLPLLETEIRDDDVLRVGSSESLEDAPEIALPRTPSVVMEVTGMKLHLDDDSEEYRRESESMRTISKTESEKVSVTSIEFAATKSASSVGSPKRRYSAEWAASASASASASFESDEGSELSVEEQSIQRKRAPHKGLIRGLLFRRGRRSKVEI